MEIKLINVRYLIRKRHLLMIMRTFIFLLCTTVFSFNTESSIAQEKVTIDVDKFATIDEVFEIIIDQTKYRFLYPEGLFKNLPKVQLKKGIIRVDKLLNQSLGSGQFNVVVSENNTIVIKDYKSQQQRQVSGKVIDVAGLPVVGVTVLIKGTNIGTSTDFDGKYAITVNNPENVLVFSGLGFVTQEITVYNQSVIDVIFKESISELDQVTINAGYYKTTQRESTGSIAKIDAKTIEKQPVNNPLGAIQGYISGVDIVQTTGVPGGGFDIQIRGKNFINGGTNPLFIVDGVPFGGESLESYSVSGQINGGNTSPLNAISSEDIESIEVLKDADATAIYGSRGANGVVLISTKKGKSGKTQFKANVSTTLGHVSHFRDLMNTEQFLELFREGIVNDGFGAFLEDPAFDFVWPELKTWDQNRYTDWQEELIGGTAYRNKIQLSVSGGSDQTQFLISGAHQKETTVFPGDANYKKATVYSNVNHLSNDGRFKINLSTNYAIENNLLPRSDFTNLAYTLAPNTPELYNEDGNYNWPSNSFDNPFARLEEEYHVKINTLISNMVISYKIFPNLEARTNFGYNKNNIDSYVILPHTARNPIQGYTSINYSTINTNTSNRDSWIIEPQLNWKHQWGDVKYDILLGSTFQRETIDQLVLKGTGFASNNLLLNISAAETIEAIQNSDSEYSYQALFGRLNINWKDKYILNITGRRDGSSRFGPGKQFGNFGAIGAAWLFSNENIFKESSVLSFGKLRASYGTTGSDNIGDYRFLDTYSVTGFDYNGTSTLEPTGIFNPLLAWEENKKLEAALEIGLFKDRIFLTTAWYDNRSSNQLIGVPLAATTGFSTLDGNFDATVQNTGFEIDLRTINFQKNNFNWSTTFNITIPENKLLKFKDIESSTFANRYIVGESLSIRQLYHALGVNPDTGVYEFEDFNQDGEINSLYDRQIIKDFAPEFYGGLGNTISYKNLSLDFFFQFKKQIRYNYLSAKATPGGQLNGPIELYDRWQQAGDISPHQQASFLYTTPDLYNLSELQSSSDAAISDASFIRLRNISLTYKVPKKVSSGLDLSVYIQGQNLLTITGYKYLDPEQLYSNTLPPLRQFTIGLNLGF
ncbi:SusC/RagA family TonB-linked outer membrane protein [Gelidibacter sp. F63206]|uniref:SusC/RagA family TonB-linked outer membrane protein n=1 Tax=Gelidibacter sp. F63206 TaxID=2926425 RepID=UPI001FF503CF|nr:SusC/RagA family TonB-linked outer membrane protein [Gelidibacter sp. F63206]MCK0114820.1 SusC/RagA family TonB-linked outer membrane protein [Gelidibacter sp. F63206]